MPFSSIFNTIDVCKENRCKIDRQNIKMIYKPDSGFLDTKLRQKLFPSNSYKICDCIVICKTGNIVIVEILCGKLTYREYKEKCEQLENCCKVVNHLGLKPKITKIVLIYQSRESDKKNPQFRKKLLNTEICSFHLHSSQKSTYNIGC